MNNEEMTFNIIWDLLVDMELFTAEELELVTNINGYTVETLNDCVYVRTGYRTAKQFFETIQEEE